MFASIHSAVVLGARGFPVTVEVSVADGLPGFKIVGLPDESVREARDRVRAAYASIGFKFPDVRVTVNLSPSQIRKAGAGLDLAIALGVLVADGNIERSAVERLGFIGELGLDGTVRPVAGAAPMVGVLGERDAVVPVGNLAEAEIAARGRVRPVERLDDVVGVLLGAAPWPDVDRPPAPPPPPPPPDLADVRGQPLARLALEVAAAGGHHVLLVGPPGAGKTMLATRLPGLLPDLDLDRALETTMVHSAAGVALPASGLVTRPPFRSPHHTSTKVAIVGGGSGALRPGELSLATNGVLFLDELPEFAPSVVDSLRQPLEEGTVHVSRAGVSATMPAQCQLVAAMNPCPCGGGDGPAACECGESRIDRYAGRVSGALRDRFDLRLTVAKPAVDELFGGEPGEATSVVAPRVASAQRLAVERQGCLNARLPPPDLDRHAVLADAARRLLRAEVEAFRLSARGYHRVRRVARTLVDLRAVAGGEPDEVIGEADAALALELRSALSTSRRRRAVA